MKISTVTQMRNLDKGAIEKYGIIPQLLMENAGLAVYEMISQELGVDGMRFAIFCGPGNNGGDGMVVARKILSSGGEPIVYLMNDPSDYAGTARQNYEIIEKLGVEIERVVDPDSIWSRLVYCDAVVDGILGTGITGEVRENFRRVIDMVNASGLPVFSIDIPSGVRGDTGEVMGAAVIADATTTFGLPKIGNMIYPGFDLCGKLMVSHISFPPHHYESEEIMIETLIPTELPERDMDGHKGTFGQALFVAGASGYMGAPYFSAMSFLRAGGGYSRLATPESISPFLASRGSEIVMHPMKETASGSMSLVSLEPILEIARGMDFVVLGPGLSLDEETRELAREVVRGVDRPMLIDGDGITAVCEDLSCVRERKWPTVLTPHPGELARLASSTIREVLSDRLETVRKMSGDLEAMVVLKTAHSLVGTPDGLVRMNLSGNPGMGSAGSGDVLTGTIAAMFGLGLDFDEAVCTGVFMHGFAGDLASNDKGEDGITAGDILEYLPLATRTFREEYEEVIADCYGKVFVI